MLKVITPVVASIAIWSAQIGTKVEPALAVASSVRTQTVLILAPITDLVAKAVVKDTYFYTMKIGSKTKGFGHTKNLMQRVSTHKRNCIKSGTKCELISAELMTKPQALAKEAELRNKFIKHNTGIEGFKTEAIPLTFWESTLHYLKKQIASI